MTRGQLQALVLLGVIWLAGCGGCNQEKPAAPAAAPIAVTPTTSVSANTPAAAAGGGAGATTPQGAEAADCFVIVDAEPDFGAPPLTVHFTTETDCTGAPVTFSWDFGDGTKGGNDPKPSHTYDKAGDYVATVSTAAPDGGSGSDEIDISVDADLVE
jgi:PKD repeat protein